MTMRAAAFLLTILLGTAAMAAPMTWPELLGRSRPAPTARIAYGADPLQHADLWLPPGRGPFPVVLMVHGGCWQTGIAEADIMDWAAADLAARGIAVWNIEYRGVDRPGGGYPGTFHDVAAAADALSTAAKARRLDPGRVVALGHSAGGHLALWLAARPGLPAASPFHPRAPLALRAAFSLGGLPDLEAAGTPPGDTCGPDVVARLVGHPSPGRPNVYADTSPAVMTPPRLPVTLVNGSIDPIAPPAFAEAYSARMGGTPRRVVIPGAGHVELIAPGSRAWAETVRRVEAALGGGVGTGR